jgi:Conjugative transposon protein TcpC
MFRLPNTGNGSHLSDYSPVAALNGSASPGLGWIENEIGSRGPTEPPAGPSWNGAGGRWRLWPLRLLLWATLLIIAFRGVTAIIFNQGTALRADGTTAAAATAAQFPVTLGEAYAMAFGQVYLNFSPATQAQREQQLAAFVPASVAAANPDLGWNGAGQLSLQSEQVAGITVSDPTHAVVTLLASVNGQLMELGVPVVASGGGVVIPGEPAWLPAPPRITPPAAASPGSDPAAQAQLMAELPGFFQAYAAGDSAALSRFEVRGVTLTFGSIAGLDVPPGGATRQITVTVIWQVATDEASVTKLAAAYAVSVTETRSGKWYVNEISAVTEAVEAK